VLFALQDICEGNYNLHESKLVTELHNATIKMYEDNLIRELPSCLMEVLETALRRYSTLGLCEIKTYSTSSGSSISFVSVPFDLDQKLESYKRIINNVQQFSTHDL